MTQTATLIELRDFVIIQAAEDSVLSPYEQNYQAELVRDVLGQEIKRAKLINELMVLYKAGTKTATPSRR